MPTECFALTGFTVLTDKPARGGGSSGVLKYVDPGERFDCALLPKEMLALMVERGEIEFARPTT